MNNVPEVIANAGIFKPGDIYVFSEDDRGYGLDVVDYVYIVKNEEDILLGLEFDIGYLAEEELLEIMSCERVNDNSFKLELSVRVEGEEELQTLYLHRLVTIQERIAEEQMNEQRS